MTLQNEILQRRNDIRTDGYSMSIGELMNMYRDGELDIHPEFQRYYRWTDLQKTRLIESILLGIPLPSIFVSQKQDGSWDVIDGLQRLSAIFEVAGILKDKTGQAVSPLVLTGTDYLPSLAGKRWESENPEDAIGGDNQLLIRRTKLDIKIVLRESTATSKYELFQRLNTGGSHLTDQEVRNVMLIMVNPQAHEWVDQLASLEAFKQCIALSDRLLDEQYHLELALRFIVLRRVPEGDLRNIGDIGDFLDKGSLKFAQAADFAGRALIEKQAFEFTFQTLADTLGENSFQRYDPNKQKYLGMFLISSFEAIALGLGYHYEEFKEGANLPDIRNGAVGLWTTKDFTDNSGSGIRASSRIPHIVPLGRKVFAPQP